MSDVNPAQYYLNDSVINDYLKLLVQRDSTVYCFDTFFYSSLKKRGFESIKRWTKNVDIFSKRILLMPMNIVFTRTSHWILVSVNVQEKIITCYDSLNIEKLIQNALNITSSYLQSEHIDKFGTHLLINEWKLVKGVNPEQKNSVDCGVFLCTFCEYLSRNAPFNFDQSHMLSFRQLISYELTMKRLINVDVPTSEIKNFINNVLQN